MASIIYCVAESDMRHPHRGVYVDIDGCFEGPVGPFDTAHAARAWVKSRRDRLVELYGPESAEIFNQPDA